MFSIERLISGAAANPTARFSTERLLLRPPERRDYAAWARVRGGSRAHLQPWEPAWARDHLTERSFRRRVAWAEREIAADRAYPLLVFLVEPGGNAALAGGVTIEHIRRGAAQTGALGYWLGADFEGRGLMSEALCAIVNFAFGALDLSRLEAACLPENMRSRRLLERCGFALEARLAGYLQIDGAWRDHLLFERRRADRLGVAPPAATGGA